MAEYRRVIEHKRLHVLDIPDDYQFMDTELVELLNASVGAIPGIQGMHQKNVDQFPPA